MKNIQNQSRDLHGYSYESDSTRLTGSPWLSPNRWDSSISFRVIKRRKK